MQKFKDDHLKKLTDQLGGYVSYLWWWYIVGVILCFVFQRCAEIQRESLAYKKSTFGELSAEVAEALQLIGGVEMTQGQMRHAQDPQEGESNITHDHYAVGVGC